MKSPSGLSPNDIVLNDAETGEARVHIVDRRGFLAWAVVDPPPAVHCKGIRDRRRTRAGLLRSGRRTWLKHGVGRLFSSFRRPRLAQVSADEGGSRVMA